uniref:Interleukin-18-binding protein-like domain-containing protein n=1 Tax=Anas zonorhyncha TaxID=75864 RepID=A0A8B9VHI5_9AVES
SPPCGCRQSPPAWVSSAGAFGVRVRKGLFPRGALGMARGGCTAGPLPPPLVPAHFPPFAGCSVKISCEAVSSLPEVTLLYWLGNGSFIEKLHPDGAVHEGMLLEEPRGSGVVLRRDLLFSSFSARDLRTNFTCVVLSPIGLDTRELRWGPPQPAPTESRELG